jgi:putative ABC transport system substrate-binding protein
MRRRDFIKGMAASPVLWPLAAGADTLPLIGYLSSRSPDSEAAVREPFLEELEKAGFIAGHTVTIEYRFTEGRSDHLSSLATEFVNRGVTVLVATDRPTALAAKAATTTIPIVFSSGDDPVRIGLVARLNNPGGNATGISVFTTQLGAKRLELLRQILPKLGPIAFVIDPNNSSSLLQVKEMQTAADALSQTLVVLNVGTERAADEAFATMAQRKVSGILYGTTTFFQVISGRLIALAAQHKIPASYEWRDAVVAGGLMSYNTNRDEIGRQIGKYTAEILKGAKPATLPVVQSSSFVFVINLMTAKALGLTVPPILLSTADEVIE